MATKKRAAKKTAKKVKTTKTTKKAAPRTGKAKGGRPKRDMLEVLPSYSPIGEADLDNVRAAFPTGSLHTLNPLFIANMGEQPPLNSVITVEAVVVEDGFVNVVFSEVAGRFVVPAGWLLSRVVRRPALELALLGRIVDEPTPEPARGYIDADISDQGIAEAVDGTAADVVADDEPVVSNAEHVAEVV